MAGGERILQTGNGGKGNVFRLVSLSLSLTIINSIAPAVSAAVPTKTESVSQTAGNGANSARSLLDAIVQAYGGSAVVKEHHEHPMRFRGSLSCISGISSASNTYDCEVLQKGDKLRMEMTVLGEPLVMGFDGKHGWTQCGDWTAPDGPIATSVISESITHGLPILSEALEPGKRLEFLGRRQSCGKNCDVLKVTGRDGSATTFYADPQSHLILRAEYAAMDQETGNPATQALEYDDYRVVAGSPEPFHIVQYSSGKKKMETFVKSIDANIAIDDKAFAMPQESEVSRLKTGPVTLPFEYENEKIVILCRINNGPERRFIIDTGSSQSVVDKTYATEFGAKGSPTYSVTAGAKSIPMSYVALPSLSFGDISLNDVPVLVTDLSGVGSNVSGLIGANILKRFSVTLDYDNRTVTFSDPRNVSVPKGAYIVGASPAFGGNQMLVRGKLDDSQVLSFLLDTGTSFNNLPKSLAQKLYGDSILPTQTVSGLDGQSIQTGSVRLHSLKLGNAVVPFPVFRVVVNSPAKSSGLLNAGGLGILGNSVWSQFRTTIDYRNERLILESQPGRLKSAAFLEQIYAADRQYLRTKDGEAAIKTYQKIAASARSDGNKSIEALAIGRVAGSYGDRFTDTKDGKWLDEAGHLYEEANKLATEAHDRVVHGQVLAQWAMLYFNAPRSQDEVNAAQGMIAKAIQKAPLDPSILATFGTIMLRLGKKTEAQKFLDSALSIDPSNWQALWSKYKLCEDQGDKKLADGVAAQMAYYYPSFPEVAAIVNSGRKN